MRSRSKRGDNRTACEKLPSEVKTSFKKPSKKTVRVIPASITNPQNDNLRSIKPCTKSPIKGSIKNNDDCSIIDDNGATDEITESIPQDKNNLKKSFVKIINIKSKIFTESETDKSFTSNTKKSLKKQTIKKENNSSLISDINVTKDITENISLDKSSLKKSLKRIRTQRMKPNIISDSGIDNKKSHTVSFSSQIKGSESESKQLKHESDSNQNTPETKLKVKRNTPKVRIISNEYSDSTISDDEAGNDFITKNLGNNSREDSKVTSENLDSDETDELELLTSLLYYYIII